MLPVYPKSAQTIFTSLERGNARSKEAAGDYWRCGASRVGELGEHVRGQINLGPPLWCTAAPASTSMQVSSNPWVTMETTDTAVGAGGSLSPL